MIAFGNPILRCKMGGRVTDLPLQWRMEFGALNYNFSCYFRKKERHPML